jgi:hypothetical protein
MSADREYAEYVLLKEPYVAAIRAAGNQPWWYDDAHAAKLEHRVPGITNMTPDQRRRALWDRSQGNR